MRRTRCWMRGGGVEAAERSSLEQEVGAPSLLPGGTILTSCCRPYTRRVPDDPGGLGALLRSPVEEPRRRGRLLLAMAVVIAAVGAGVVVVVRSLDRRWS